MHPDKDNAVLINEKEIKCYTGTITYKIINSEYKKYFVLIKNYYIRSYGLYDEKDNILSYETYAYNDYYFLVKNKVLYLVVETYSQYCLSFIFLDTNYIKLEENKEFLHPIVDYKTIFEVTLENTLNKDVHLYFKNINSMYHLNINGKQEILYSYTEKFSFHSEKSESKIKIEILSQDIVVSIKYTFTPESESNDSNDKKEETGVKIYIIIVIIILSLFFCGIGCIFLYLCCSDIISYKYQKDREKKSEMRILETNKLLDRASNLYDLIKNDYSLIEKVCLLCAENDKSPLFNVNEDYYENTNINNDNNKNNLEIDFIDDINNGNFTSFMKYITPKICNHFYHDNCCEKYKEDNYIKKNNKKDYIQNVNKCNFCKFFITYENMQKFGYFFSRDIFQNLFKYEHNKNENDKKEVMRNIEDIFYSKIDNSWKIDRIKREKLIKMKKINKKYINNLI